ncbi:uncharacterized protein LOC129759341 [Uranotaenia lowii]|nr:uncharacterized protein LOC129759341 [Uranotaenia lowii]
MKALDDGRKLDDEILLTTLAEAVDMINCRPLTYMPQESPYAVEDGPLTPNHFMRGVVKAEDYDVDESVSFANALRNTYKRSQYLANEMWKRWYKEYLPTINCRTKWFEKTKPIQKDDLVFIVNDSNRKKWIRGIVEQVIPGADGQIRQAMVRTNGGTHRRAVTNLAVLEICCGNSGSPGGTEPGVTGWGVVNTTG